ncbi:MAG: sugar phosphate nucleotidyltransferase [Patescibacteria group bacterium]|nr:sugar phosphate nucleotidyltransferase [Patescibacteria group bacterium]
MKLIIFAGGIGTRLWPLSRENSPKQFDKIFSGKSTLELAINRVEKVFGIENILIQTMENYKDEIKKQIPNLPDNNIIIEPCRRNLGPAVCLSAIELKNRGFAGPVALLWADHLMKRPEEFINALKKAESLIKKDSKRFVFIGEQPRFANNNLGWIQIGDQSGEIDNKKYYNFLGWKYKPAANECSKMFESGDYLWNPGYFITSIEFLLNCYKELSPTIYKDVNESNYAQAEAIHFDRAIAEKLDLSQAVVIKTNMGWSDPGTLYALKEALAKTEKENVLEGNISCLNTSDCLLYNLEKNKLVTAVGLNGMAIVNTPDALVVVSKKEVVNITNLVKQLRKEGKEKYL